MFSKIVLNKISHITVLLTQCKFIYSQIESSRIKVSVMRLVTFIYNQNITRLYQDHLNKLDCVSMAKNLIYNIPLLLRNADFKISVLYADAKRLTTKYVLFQ